jgi:hypothetical protein
MYPVEESEGVNMLLSKEVTLRKRKNEAVASNRIACTCFDVEIINIRRELRFPHKNLVYINANAV